MSLLRLEEYLPAFLEQNYQTVDDVAQLIWEDLEEFGIVKLGHQKKIMLAIKRINDIKAGKRINSDTNRIYATQVSGSTKALCAWCNCHLGESCSHSFVFLVRFICFVYFEHVYHFYRVQHMNRFWVNGAVVLVTIRMLLAYFIDWFNHIIQHYNLNTNM